MSLGIQPDFLFCRCEVMLPNSVKTKMALFCNIEESHIISAIDVSNIYEVPLVFHEQKADKIILEGLNLPSKKPDLLKWRKMVDIVNNSTETVNIALVGKYITLEDTYKSVDAALKHGGISNKVKVNIKKIDAEHYEAEIFEDGLIKQSQIESFAINILDKLHNEDDINFINTVYDKDLVNNHYVIHDNISEEDKKRLRELFRFVDYKGLISTEIDGLLIPGGFGNRGIEGKIKAIRYSRENKIPAFGICLGLQCMVIEYARHICGIPNAHSREFEPYAENPVIELLANLKGINYMGGTMRKGAAKSKIKKGTLAHAIYEKDEIEERHRHRYEVNPDFVELLVNKGLIISAYAESGLVEMVELKDHPWFLGGQFHPEFKSSPIAPHPIFISFIEAADKHRIKRKAG
jgi:CTP synthase